MRIRTLLTPRSGRNVVNDVSKTEEKIGKKHTGEDVDRDFSSGGFLPKLYWNNYLENFNPDFVLEQSRWEMGEVEKDRAGIIIRYKKSEGPATLQMYKEQGR